MRASQLKPTFCDQAVKPEGGALHSVQRAGVKPTNKSLHFCAGVYVGCSYQDYTDVVLAVTAKLAPQAVVGSGASFMVGRLSYAFGLTGAEGFSNASPAMSQTPLAQHAAPGLRYHNLAVACRALRLDRYGVLIIAGGHPPGALGTQCLCACGILSCFATRVLH